MTRSVVRQITKKGAVLPRLLNLNYGGLKMEALTNRLVFQDRLEFIEGFNKGILGAV